MYSSRVNMLIIRILLSKTALISRRLTILARFGSAVIHAILQHNGLVPSEEAVGISHFVPHAEQFPNGFVRNPGLQVKFTHIIHVPNPWKRATVIETGRIARFL